MILGSRSLETTKTAKSSWQFILRNELQDYTMCFNYIRILPSTFDELVSLVRPFVIRNRNISFFFFLTSVIKARQFSHWFDKLFFVDEFSFCHYICPTSEALSIVLKQSVASKMDFFISDTSWRIHEKTRCVRMAVIPTNHIWSASECDASRPVWIDRNSPTVYAGRILMRY